MPQDGFGQARVLAARPLAVDGRDESWLRDFLLAHPIALPASEIDPAFADLIPICRELNTRAGRIDGLFINRHGALVLVECKLWRNPEARREVVAQILDYAKELARWQYEDLQREVSRATGRPGENVLFQEVAARHPDTREASFVDAVSRNLEAGRFLLLIVGDGIREGTESIARYVTAHMGLRFTLGLVEMAAHDAPGGGLLVQPRLLARTVNIERGVIRIDPATERAAVDDAIEADEGEAIESSQAGRGRAFPEELKQADRESWRAFRDRLALDDPAQPGPVTGYGRARLEILPGLAWLNVFSARSDNLIGVDCVLKGQRGQVLYDALSEQRDAIDQELAPAEPNEPVLWRAAMVGRAISVRRRQIGEWSIDHEAGNLAWLLRAANVAVNVFRPRLLELARSNDA